MIAENGRQLPACLSIMPIKLSLSKKGIVGPSELQSTPDGAETAFHAYAKLQEHENWCWAAVTASLTAYYFKSNNPRRVLTQEQVVCGFYNLPDGTCSIGNYHINEGQCNKTASTYKAMSRFGVLGRAEGGRPDELSIRGELVAGRPIVVAILPFNAKVGHAVVISALRYLSSNAVWQYKIYDPTVGGNWVDIKSFPAKYPPGNNWDGTFFSDMGSPS